ncbi:hypothetical protein AGMMS50239_30410 [Bacteroidia bacterium]|nr:hypothetical protein AGMMS50239_30410 [Bacteroidia bacterium]
MKVFKKLFERKKKNTTLMYHCLLFEDFDHQLPKKDKDSHNQFLHPVMFDIIRLHYHDALKPPKKWNYDNTLVALNLRGKEVAHLDFRDTDTYEINDKAKYKAMCDNLKSLWKDILIKRFPKYSKEKLEDGFEKIQIDYFPSRCLLVLSMLLDGVMKNSTDEYRK